MQMYWFESHWCELSERVLLTSSAGDLSNFNFTGGIVNTFPVIELARVILKVIDARYMRMTVKL